MLWQRYYRPHTVEEALALLAGTPGAAVLAGGTDLILELQQGRRKPLAAVVDVAAIPELLALEVRQDHLFVGAAVPLSRIAASPWVKRHARALAEATGQMAGPQVRRVATLGGNVAHALPAADGAIALLALDGQAEVAGPQGRRRVPLADLYLGPGRSALGPAQLLVGFHLPLSPPGAASAFRRVMRPQGVALPILNCAVWLQRQGERIAQVRIAVGPFGPVPRRAVAAEGRLCGQPFTPQTVEQAVEALLQEARFRTSPYRATQGYRRHLAGVLLQETLRLAWERAGERDDAGPEAPAPVGFA